MGQTAVWQSSLITYVVTPNKTTSLQTTLHHDIVFLHQKTATQHQPGTLRGSAAICACCFMAIFFTAWNFGKRQKLRSSVQKYVVFCCVGKNDQEHSLQHAGNNRLLYITNQLSVLNCSILASNLVRNLLCLSRE